MCISASTQKWRVAFHIELPTVGDATTAPDKYQCCMKTVSKDWRRSDDAPEKSTSSSKMGEKAAVTDYLSDPVKEAEKEPELQPKRSDRSSALWIKAPALRQNPSTCNLICPRSVLLLLQDT